MSLVSEAHRRHWQQRQRCVEGLPADALFAAMHQVDQLQRDVADPELLIPVDLVRLEALPEHWQKRIRERARLVREESESADGFSPGSPDPRRAHRR